MTYSFVVPEEWRTLFLSEAGTAFPLSPITEVEVGFFQLKTEFSPQNPVMKSTGKQNRGNYPEYYQITSCLFQGLNMQVLPQASIRQGAEMLADWLNNHIKCEGELKTWSIKLGSIAKGLSSPAQSQRAKLLENALEQILRSRNGTTENSRTLQDGDILVWAIVLTSGKIALAISSSGSTSTASHANLFQECWHLAGARPDLIYDEEPPSRAYMKLREGFQRFNYRPVAHSTAVDLGASPGGWTWELARYALQITSVDRALLDEKIRALPNVVEVIGDALRFTPALPVETLVCDVIAFPEISFDILTQWLVHRRCRFFFITFKFKREPDWKWLIQTQKQLAPLCSRLMMRKLESNKNEIMVMGERA